MSLAENETLEILAIFHVEMDKGGIWSYSFICKVYILSFLFEGLYATFQKKNILQNNKICYYHKTPFYAYIDIYMFMKKIGILYTRIV